ncbi:hypothetical protein ACEWY4_005442 [Coilia grayii]|uniref:Reverse transcriptase domain-containing protein n=1 Tax=Coilia grayii TaxID=363190 RepID=A0ABD1KIG7_9TELE
MWLWGGEVGLHFILQHLDQPGARIPARILFVDFISVFNTVIFQIFTANLSLLTACPAICQWISSFMTDRSQHMWLGDVTSGVWTSTTSTGAPQGYVLCPLLFSFYTNDCTSKDPAVKLLTFADDISFINISLSLHFTPLYFTSFHTLKIVNMVVDFRKHPTVLPHPHNIQQPGVKCVFIPVSGIHHFPGSEMRVQRQHHPEKSSAEDVLSTALVETWPTTIAIGHLYCCHRIHSLFPSFTFWFGAATTQDKHRLQFTIRAQSHTH